MREVLNFINGEYAKPISDNWLDNYEPATGKIYGRIANSDTNDVAAAVNAAQTAFKTWSISDTEWRSAILERIAQGIEKKLHDLALAESKDNGKPVKLAMTVDIPRAAANFRFFSRAITQFATNAHENPATALNFTLRQPLGVVGCISPWNLPLYLFTWKIAPALAAGNCVVAKPSEVTPVTACMLAKICNEAGLPAGVLNIVNGKGEKAGHALTENPKIKAISFTGGTATGAKIAQVAAARFTKTSLELGGKNPNIIFADCDYAQMLTTTLRSSFSNQGQICLCGSRILVERTIYDRFINDFVAAVQNLKIKPPTEEDADLGALVSAEHLQKVQKHIKRALDEGGKLLCGGKRVFPKGFEEGYYLEPTVIEVDSNTCALNQEEVFGPVVSVLPFDSETEALKLANEVRYGLSATVWTNNLKRSLWLARNVQAGIVWVNTWMLRDLRTPFGGVKDSGLGREGGFEALRFFTEAKNVCFKYEN